MNGQNIVNLIVLGGILQMFGLRKKDKTDGKPMHPAEQNKAYALIGLWWVAAFACYGTAIVIVVIQIVRFALPYLEAWGVI